VFDIVELISQTVVLPSAFVNRFLSRGAMFAWHQRDPEDFVRGNQAGGRRDALLCPAMFKSRRAIIQIAWGGPGT
jgi:hypothetical protein